MDSVIQINLGNIIVGTVTTAVLLTFAGWLFKKWIGARIEKSIQHAYDKQLEDYKFSRLKRQKAELIATLFSKWTKYYGRETIILSKQDLMSYYEDLNRMSLELSLWLEDERILNDVMNRLQNLAGAKELRDLVGDVRGFLLEKKDGSFDPINIVLRPLPTEINTIYGPRP
jgi:hypothetical protein